MGTLDLAIAASADDGMQDTGDAVNITWTFAISDDTRIHIGLRFVGTIPAGSTNILAQLGVYIWDNTFDEPQHQLRGQAAAAPVTFTTTSNDIDARTRTTATIQWNSTDLGAAGNDLWEWGATVAGAGNGVDIGSIIQENVTAFGELTAMVFIAEQHTWNSLRDLAIRTFDIGSNFPLLHIEYEAGGGTAVPVFEHHYRMMRSM